MDVFFFISSGLALYLSGCIVGGVLGIIYVLFRGVLTFFLSKIEKIFFLLPQLPKEIRDQDWQEAADFVHAKHRVGEHDYFHEYLWVAVEFENKKYDEFMKFDSTRLR